MVWLLLAHLKVNYDETILIRMMVQTREPHD